VLCGDRPSGNVLDVFCCKAGRGHRNGIVAQRKIREREFSGAGSDRSIDCVCACGYSHYLRTTHDCTGRIGHRSDNSSNTNWQMDEMATFRPVDFLFIAIEREKLILASLENRRTSEEVQTRQQVPNLKLRDSFSICR
jgi:hypothetical protein